MEPYIKKSALVAEIERRIEAHKETLKNCDSSTSEMVLKGSMSAYQSLLHFLDTLETKEVDLEKECKIYLKNNFTSKEVPDEFLTTQMQLDDMVLFAKHFYELGLAQKGE